DVEAGHRQERHGVRRLRCAELRVSAEFTRLIPQRREAFTGRAGEGLHAIHALLEPRGERDDAGASRDERRGYAERQPSPDALKVPADGLQALIYGFRGGVSVLTRLIQAGSEAARIKLGSENGAT